MDHLVTNGRVASMRGDAGARYGALDADAMGFAGGRITWIFCDVAHPADLAYRYGTRRSAAIFRAGQPIKPRHAHR